MSTKGHISANNASFQASLFCLTKERFVTLSLVEIDPEETGEKRKKAHLLL